LKDLVPQILAYVSSPFRLFAIVIMAVLTFAGYFVWQNQAVMLGAYAKSKELPTMNSSRYEKASRLVLKNSGASFVAIFKVDPILGKRVVEAVYTKDGQYKEFDGHDIGLFTANHNNNRDVISLMANQIPCDEYPTPQSEIGLWYKSLDVNYTCRISVPADSNQFIGQITVGWKAKPQEPSSILQIASQMLMRK
jgi:hypothetical protein